MLTPPRWMGSFCFVDVIKDKKRDREMPLLVLVEGKEARSNDAMTGGSMVPVGGEARSGNAMNGSLMMSVGVSEEKHDLAMPTLGVEESRLAYWKKKRDSRSWE